MHALPAQVVPGATDRLLLIVGTLLVVPAPIALITAVALYFILSQVEDPDASRSRRLAGAVLVAYPVAAAALWQ